MLLLRRLYKKGFRGMRIRFPGETIDVKRIVLYVPLELGQKWIRDFLKSGRWADNWASRTKRERWIDAKQAGLASGIHVTGRSEKHENRFSVLGWREKYKKVTASSFLCKKNKTIQQVILMRILKNLFDKNKKWSEKVKKSDPDFFIHLSRQQNPEYLWIGCSDSRVPANQIVDMLPGEIFVHRNIANVVVHTDLNCLSVIQYAVEILKVKHIIVCGHYGCGGIRAAMENKEHGLIDNWLQNIKDVYRYHQARIDVLQDEREKINLLCELNVIEQVANICHTTIVQNAWKSGRELTVHGWIYSIEDGILKDLNVCTTNLDEISQTHRLK